MTFPTTSVLDSFNRANTGPPPSASWTTDVAGFGDAGLKVVSNQCVGNNTGSDNSGYWNAATFGPDCEAYATIVTRPNNGQYFGIYIRLQSPGGAGIDGYYVEYLFNSGGTDTVAIYRLDNRAFTKLGADISQDFSDGDGLGIECIGSTITVYRRSAGTWSSIGSRTDATYGSAGYIGLAIHDNAKADDWGGGTIVAGGTQYSQSVSGTLTSAGSVVKQDQTAKVGTLTSAGALNRQTQASKVGTLMSAGSLVKQTAHRLAGTLTSSGALAATRAALISIGGTLASTGSLAKQTSAHAAGSLGSVGGLVKQAARVVAGTLTSSGALASVKAALVSIGGTLPSSGALSRRTAISTAGTLTTTGTLIKQSAKRMVGALTGAGTIAAVRAALVSVGGALTMAGGLVKHSSKGLGATLDMAGSLVKRTAMRVGGVLSAAGQLIAAIVGAIVEELAYQGDATIYDSAGATGAIGSGTVLALPALAGATGSMAGGLVQPNDTIYDSTSATGSIAGTTMPPDVTYD